MEEGVASGWKLLDGRGSSFWMEQGVASGWKRE